MMSGVQEESEPLRPTTAADRKAWQTYWEACGQPWRTEPEIGQARQLRLMARLKVEASSEKGIYPFRGKHLSRADVEWLLAHQEQGKGPLTFPEATKRDGLDLRGADLSQENLAGLPLIGLIGGLQTPPPGQDRYEAREQAAINLKGATLDGATLSYAHLEGGHLEGASLRGAQVEYACLDGAHFQGANLQKANFYQASLQWTWLEEVHAEEAEFWEANMQQVQLTQAHLEHADLYNANLERAELMDVHLEGAELDQASLAGASLHRVFFHRSTDLLAVDLGDAKRGFTSFSQVRWDEIDLDQITWSVVPMLGNEEQARRERQLWQFQQAVKVTRSLSRALYAQGLDEVSTYFAVRSRRMERSIFFLRRQWLAWLAALLSDWFDQYGYRPQRRLAWIIAVLWILVAVGRLWHVL